MIQWKPTCLMRELLKKVAGAREKCEDIKRLMVLN